MGAIPNWVTTKLAAKGKGGHKCGEGGRGSCPGQRAGGGPSVGWGGGNVCVCGVCGELCGKGCVGEGVKGSAQSPPVLVLGSPNGRHLPVSTCHLHCRPGRGMSVTTAHPNVSPGLAGDGTNVWWAGRGTSSPPTWHGLTIHPPTRPSPISTQGKVPGMGTHQISPT